MLVKLTDFGRSLNLIITIIAAFTPNKALKRLNQFLFNRYLLLLVFFKSIDSFNYGNEVSNPSNNACRYSTYIRYYAQKAKG